MSENEKDFKEYLLKYVNGFSIPPAHASEHLVVKNYGYFKGLTDDAMKRVAEELEKEIADGK